MRMRIGCVVTLAIVIVLEMSVGLEYDTNRPGSDYRSFEVYRANPEECRNACATDGKCRAYTYVRPGVQGRTARCYLKSAVPRPVADRCCISGVKSAGR